MTRVLPQAFRQWAIMNRIAIINEPAGEEGLGSGLRGPEPCVLPLGDSPAAPQKPAGIGQRVQSLLSDPPNRPRLLIRGAQVRALHGLPDLTCLSQSYQPEAQEYQVPKDQSAKRGPTGPFISFPTRARGYNEITDNANEPPPLLTAPYETASHLEARLTLPEYGVEVVP